MGQAPSSLPEGQLQGQREVLLTDIVIERTDNSHDHRPSLSLMELWVFVGEATPLVLTQTSPQRWEAKDFIKLPSGENLDGIDCVVKCDEGEDFSFVHIDCQEMVAENAGFQCGYSKSMETCDPRIDLAASWRVVIRASEPSNDPAALNKMGGDLLMIFRRTGDSPSLIEAVTLLHMAVELTPDGHADLPRRLGNLGVALKCRFGLTGRLSDVDEAISVHQKAVKFVPEDYVHRAAMISNLGISFMCRFEHSGSPSDVDEAVSAFRRAVELTPEDHQDMPDLRSSLGCALLDRFKRFGHLPDIDEAISALQSAVSLALVRDPLIPVVPRNPGASMTGRFAPTNNSPDNEEVFSAVQITPRYYASLPKRLVSLGSALTHRFHRTGHLSDLAEAISAQQAAVQFTPENHANLPGRLTSLGDNLELRFKRTGHLSDIDKAVTALEKAAALTTVDDPCLPERLGNLGGSLIHRFEYAHNLSDVAQAILLMQRAIGLTPEGHPTLRIWLANLATSFSLRFKNTRDLSDLTEAISGQKRAVEITAEDDEDLPALLNNLGSSLLSRFQRTGDIADIAEGIRVTQRSVDLTPEGKEDLPRWLDNLGNTLACRFEATHQFPDLVKAIAMQQRAVQLTPDGDPRLPRVLNDLGENFTRRFEYTGDLSDITEGISALQRALQLIPDGHAILPDSLRELGSAFLLRWADTDSVEDFNEAISNYKRAATCNIGPPRDRLHGAQLWARSLSLHNPQAPDIIPAFDAALGLFDLIGSLEQTVRNRHAQLQDVSGIALEAASSAFTLEEPAKALEWLEQGRCLVWSQIHSLRTQLDGLRACDAGLVQRIAHVSKQLEDAGSSREHSDIGMPLAQKIALQEEARRHVDLAQQWDALIGEARAIPGFESFLRPPKCSSLLQDLPESGAIVVINVHDRRCDAIALLAGLHEPFHITLPNFSVQKAKEYHRDLSMHLRSRKLRMRQPDVRAHGESSGRSLGRYRATRGTAISPVRNVLRGLWVEVVKPILDILAFTKFDRSSGREQPRIWWCPTGALSFLPLHAAGIYGGLEPESVLDYAVSSYTPTVSALTERVRNCRPIDARVSGLFLTSQPNAPRVSPIPGTTTEVRSIHKRAEGNGVRTFKVEGSDLTIRDCLQHLEDYSSVHLACHGSQNAEESLQSSFRFHEGALPLATILQKDLKNADLAFLSACQTSAGDEKLSDEAVHLAAGMLAAGYRRVVATMWSIGDTTAQEVANNFYDRLWSEREEGSGSGFDGTLSAYALHHAIQKLREDRGDSDDAILAWAPFVHFGY